MYLKEISASGFKSFADKITISLDGKITAIVGPNGSGKSNVVDAVRWVLGEQSVKSLRGSDNMTDVIFSGSKSRSALNVASVSLIFDNSDNYLPLPYNEVSIKRRVYRSGESEYFLNGEKCRLKDITDLLVDSATSKESFNIISQGEIQRILSNSSYDRRVIFESAAGVLKYKRRKEDAIKKLDKTQTNIERVLDIINELEVQLGPLKEQSEKANEYLASKEKLESIEVALLAFEIEKINYEHDLTKKKIEEINNEILSLNLKSTNGDATLVADKNKLLNLEQLLKNYNLRLLELTSKEEKLNGEKELLKERSKYSANDSKVHNNIASLKEELYQTENNIKLFVKDIEFINSNIQQINSNITKLELNLNSLKSKRSNNINDYDSKRRELFDITHKIESLTNYIESFGSLPKSVRSVLNNPRIKGIHGTLSSLLECDDAYIKALEVSLVSTKNFIIVDDEVVAKMAINYLRENNLGRATFFPMNVIKPKGIEPDVFEKVKKETGYVGLFSELVRYDSKYYNIISNQLGNVIVAENIDAANKISLLTYRRYKVVSLNGDIIHVGGSISGGSVESRSVISEKKELEELNRRKKELEELNSELISSKNALDSDIACEETKIYEEKSNLIKYEEQVKAKEEVIEELNKRKLDIDKELESLDHLVLSTLSKEEERIMKEYYEVSLEKENLIKEISFEQEKKDKLSVQIEEMDAMNKLNNQSINKLEKNLKELEINLGKMDIKIDNYLKVLSEDYSLTFEKAKNSYVLELDPDTARAEVNKYRNIIKNIGMVNLSSIEDYKKVNERYLFLTEERNDLVNAKETLYEIIGEMDKVMKEEFLSTFEKVREEFKRVFKELFNGGSADLKLTDKDNILETGVDIVASPPGKTLKSITLLSGGEMTLTAISLIFAILNIRKVPFCIFDEVEAALDEANVDNFGHYLDHYKDKTQFLIITHKKKTMEYADTLYGITMQESGVSKLVSVKLGDIDK